MKRWQDADNLAERLRLVMQEKGITQADLARRTGLSRSAVSQMLSGDRGSQGGITHITVLKLKSALGVPYSFFAPNSSRKGNLLRTNNETGIQYAEVL